jgi:hypothetical protein
MGHSVGPSKPGRDVSPYIINNDRVAVAYLRAQ